MLLPEKLILLNLNERKNKILWLGYIPNQQSLGTSLACAFLMEFYQRKRIAFENDNAQKKKWKTIIKVIDETPLEDQFLDKLFIRLKNYKKKKKLERILHRLAHLKSKRNCMALFNLLFEHLDQQGIIRLEKRMNGFSHHSGRQVLIKPEVKRNILEEINDAVFENKVPDESTLFLLTIIHARRDYFIFSKNLRKEAEERLSEILESDVFSKTLEFFTKFFKMKAVYGPYAGQL